MAGCAAAAASALSGVRCGGAGGPSGTGKNMARGGGVIPLRTQLGSGAAQSGGVLSRRCGFAAAAAAASHASGTRGHTRAIVIPSAAASSSAAAAAVTASGRGRATAAAVGLAGAAAPTWRHAAPGGRPRPFPDANHGGGGSVLDRGRGALTVMSRAWRTSLATS